MRLPVLLRLATLATLLGLIAFSLPAQDQNTDDVAAAARKAREQQKTAPKPKKVLTNDDIPSVNNAPAPDADAADPKTATDKAAAKGAGKDKESNPEDDPKTEAYWHKRFQQTRGKLAQAEKELDILQRELEKAQVEYYPDPQKALTQQYDRSDINEKTAKIDAKKKEIDSLNQQLSDMEDDLRKAGGDPGWAR
jgi:chromosome segregation ATPase